MDGSGHGVYSSIIMSMVAAVDYGEHNDDSITCASDGNCSGTKK